MKPRIIRSKDEILAVLLERKEELDISFEQLDDLAGIPAGYSSKLMGPHPAKNPGPTSLGALLGALALGICQITIAVDPAQEASIGHRWVKRKQFGPRPRTTMQCVVVQNEPRQGELRFDGCQEKDRTMSTETFTMRVESEFKRNLKQAAQKDRRTPSDFARLAIEDAIKAKEPKQGEAA
ncbi:hypothetical protein [Bradyrhizobium neotropicale]|uniref:Uncharacterized protein n=1 Tax=Bradyrhizobium neotropicale TaxID=1497615 RepID=A0A176ZB37_9BRAD|nr:hypothetical protein [Bradyrhizobium neotropicale]OAF17851.1 hypothetical protein AXW67_06945 [Bradyrhizobium neotropicale]